MDSSDEDGISRFLRIYTPGQVIFQQFDPGNAMYVINGGTVKIRLKSSQTSLAVLGKGEFFGEMALVDDGPRSATAVAGPEGARVLAIDAPHFIYLVSQQPAFALVVLRVMARRLRDKNST